MSVRMDRLNKLLLCHLHEALTVDETALARAMGCERAVARARYERLLAEGVIEGFTTRLDAAQQATYRLLVVGVPGERTTDADLEAVCNEPGVARLFTLAAHASIAFSLQGDDLPALRKQASAVAKDLGLEQHQAILVVKEFFNDPHAGAPWRNVNPAVAV